MALERICMCIKGIGLHIVNVDLDGFLYRYLSTVDVFHGLFTEEKVHIFLVLQGFHEIRT
jgi:hypothetical protein